LFDFASQQRQNLFLSFALFIFKSTRTKTRRLFNINVWLKGNSKMSTEDKQGHDARIVDQFTKQAIPFTELPGHVDSIQMLIEMSKVTSDDSVLDVACGPGMVACEFAKVARRVTGIDITEKMIEQAQKRQEELVIANLSGI